MESTSDYWKPVFFLLEQQGFDCVLYQASKVKAQPGQPKTDKLDSVWLAKVTEQGSVAGSFVPPEGIRRLRACTRYRRRLTQAMTAEKQRAEKLLEDAHLKLSSVISDVHGVSGAEMLRAIAAGERSPGVLAEMARGVMRRRLAALREALDCSFFTEEHAFVLSMMLDNTGHYSAQIAVLDEKIAVMCEPYARQVAQLDQIPGFGVKTAQDLIGDIGTDMSAFPTVGKFLLIPNRQGCLPSAQEESVLLGTTDKFPLVCARLGVAAVIWPGGWGSHGPECTASGGRSGCSRGARRTSRSPRIRC
jgi:transposase